MVLKMTTPKAEEKAPAGIIKGQVLKKISAKIKKQGPVRFPPLEGRGGVSRKCIAG